MFVIETENLTKVYRTPFTQRKIPALKDLNLSVEEGEIFGFLGPNGAGKTTAIKILTGLLQPTSGSVRIFQEEIGNLSSRERIGFLPEQPTFYHHLTGTELLDFTGRLFRMKRREREKRSEDLIRLVGLRGAERKALSQYSRGMLQRIGLAQALMNDPDLLILDEPLGGLDPLGRKDLRDIILNLKKRGKTVFFSSHILPDVELICDRVGILMEGKLWKKGPLEDLLLEKMASIEMIARNLSPSLLSEVEKRALQVVEGKDGVLITLQDENISEEVQDLIREGGGRLISLLPRRKSLEEHFVSQVRKEESENKVQKQSDNE